MAGSAAAISRFPDPSPSPEEWRGPFPDLDLVHELTLRVQGGWQVLASACQVLARSGCEFVSVHGRHYGEGNEVFSLKLRRCPDERLRAVCAEIGRIAGVASVGLSHHLGQGQDKS